jgi:hypothetical protein
VRPTKAIWTAWGLAFAGGIAVLLAAIMVLGDPCAEGAPCTSTRVTVATGLAVAGTAVAVTGGLVATYLTVRGPGPDEAGR